MQLDLFREIIVDNFAGGGGASTGIEMDFDVINVNKVEYKLLLESELINDEFTETFIRGKPKTIDGMTLPELKVYAEENEIDLGEAKKKDEVVEVIMAALNNSFRTIRRNPSTNK